MCEEKKIKTDTALKYATFNTFVSRTDVGCSIGGKNGYRSRLDKLLTAIFSLKADVIGLQEILNDKAVFNKITEEAKKKGYEFHHIEYHSRADKNTKQGLCHLGFLINLSKVKLIKNMHWENDKPYVDIIQGLILKDKQGHHILCINIHVGTSVNIRKALAEFGLQKAVSAMISQAKIKPDVIVVSGDMNAFQDCKELPRRTYLDKLMGSLKSNFPENTKSIVSCPSESARFASNKQPASFSFFPAATDYIDRNIQEAASELNLNKKQLRSLMNIISDKSSMSKPMLQKNIKQENLGIKEKHVYDKFCNIREKLNLNTIIQHCKHMKDFSEKEKNDLLHALVVIANPLEKRNQINEAESYIKLLASLLKVILIYKEDEKLDLIICARKEASPVEISASQIHRKAIFTSIDEHVKNIAEEKRDTALRKIRFLPQLLKKFEGKKPSVFPEKDKMRLSDHDPVSVKLGFKARIT